MKKFLSVVLVMILIISALPLSALTVGASEVTEYTSGYYTYIASDGVAIITYIDYEVGEKVKLPSTLGGNKVVGIGSEALSGTSITQLTIPSSIVVIAIDAFDYNPYFKSITVEEGNEAFSSQDGVLYNKEKTCLYKYPQGKEDLSYTVPNTVLEIYENAFYECDNIEEIILPDSVENIGNDAFYGCSSIEKITLPNNLKSIGDYAFCGCYTLYEVIIPNSVTDIGEGAFNDCWSLVSVKIPDGVTTIESFTFGACNQLISVIIPKSVTNIGANAFAECWNLEDVWYLGSQDKKEEINISDDNDCLDSDKWHYNVCAYGHEYGEDGGSCIECGFFWVERDGDFIYEIYGAKANILKLTSYDNIELIIPSEYKGLKVVGLCDDAIEEFNKVTSIYINENIEYIGDIKFAENCYLQEITVAENNKYFSSQDGVLFNKDKTELIGYPFLKKGKSYIIPSTVTNIRGYSFGSSYLESVVIPNGVTTINEGTFYYCALLTSVTLPKSVKKIEQDAFDWRFTLTNVWYQGSSADKVKIQIKEIEENMVDTKWHHAGMFREVDGNLYYYRNGVKSTSSGVITYDGKKIYVNKGKFTGASGLVTVNGKKAYIDKGYFTGASGLVTIGGKKMYINKGYFTGASGLVTIGGKKMYINKGYFTGASGLVTIGGKKMYINKGYFTGASGLVTISGKKMYINKGYFAGATGIATINGKKHYINKGYFTGASGKVRVGGKTYTVVKGIVK